MDQGGITPGQMPGWWRPGALTLLYNSCSSSDTSLAPRYEAGSGRVQGASSLCAPGQRGLASNSTSVPRVRRMPTWLPSRRCTAATAAPPPRCPLRRLLNGGP